MALRLLVALLCAGPAWQGGSAESRDSWPGRLSETSAGLWLPVFSDIGSEPHQREDNSAFVADREDRGVQRQLLEAQELEQGGHHLKAVSVYQACMRSSGETRVGVTSWVFWPVRDFALFRMGRMGERAMTLYREMDGPVAARRVEEAETRTDVSLMREVAETYLHTPHGQKALEWLGDRHFSRGLFELAIYEWQRYARFFPGQPFCSRLTPLKLAVCFKRTGQEEDWERVARILESRYGNEEVAVGGERTTVQVFIAALRSAPAALPDGSWPCYGGSPSNCRPVVRPTQVEGWLWSRGYLDGVRGAEQVAGGVSEESDAALPCIHPIVDGGVLYYQTGTHLVARHTTTGDVLWSFAPPIQRDGRGGEPDLFGPGHVLRQERHALALADGRIVANVATDVRRHASSKRLVCLRATDGVLLWERGGPEDEDELLARSSFVGAPAVSEGRVFAGIATNRGDPESYVVCLDAETGKLRWTTFVCLDRQAASQGPYGSRPSASGPPAVCAGLVYYGTDMGAVAALGVESGRVEWIARYPRRDLGHGSTDLFVRSVASVPGWQTTAPMVTSGMVVVTPEDSPHALCLDAATGVTRWLRPRDENVHLLGVRGGRVYLSGVRVEVLDAADGHLIARSLKFEDTPRGRGLVGPDYVYCPGRKALHRVYADTGKAGHGTPWRRGAQPGHMVQAGDVLVVAGVEGIDLYAGDDHYRQQLSRVNKQPDDALARLEVGYLGLSRNDLALATEHLNAALRLSQSGGPIRGRDVQSEARHLLFQAHTRLGDQAAKSGALQEAGEAYEKALQFAPAGQPRFTALLNLAAHREQVEQWTAAIQLYQQLLGEFPAQRVETGESSVVAGVFARERIGTILAQRGRPHYEEFEKQAAELLKQAANQDWAVRCEEVWQRFPNSEAAQDALIVLGTRNLKEGNPLRACRYWKELSHLDVERTGIIANAYLAACYAQLGEVEPARRLVDELKARHGSRLFRFFDENISFKQFGDTLFSKLVTERTPEGARNLAFPLRKAWNVGLDDCRIISLGEALRQTSHLGEPFRDRWAPALADDRLLLTGTGGTECFDTETGRLLWTQRREGPASWLGIAISLDDEQRMRKVDRIVDVPARKAGIEPGDVILRIGNTTISNDLTDVIKGSPRDRDIPFWVQRGTAQIKLAVRLWGRPERAVFAGIAGNTAVVASADGLCGLDHGQGSPVWSRAVPRLQWPTDRERRVMRRFFEPSTIESPPVQSGPMSVWLRLLALNINESILAVIDSANGDFLWEAPAGGQLVGEPILTGDVAIGLVRSPGGVTRAVVRDLWTGQVRFELTLSAAGAGVLPLLTLAGRDSLCGVVQGRLGKWDVWSARMCWSHDLDAPQASGVIAGQGRIAILSPGGSLTVLDAGTGRLLWRTALPADQNWANRSVFHGDCLFAVSDAGHLQALEATTGRVKWKSDQPAGGIETHSTLWLDGVLAVAGTGIFDHGTRAKSTQVAFRDAESGEVLQQLAIPGEIRYSTAVRGTYVIVTDQGIFGYRGPQGGGAKLN